MPAKNSMILPWAVALRGSEPGGRPLTHPVISLVGEGKEREQPEILFSPELSSLATKEDNARPRLPSQ